MFTLCLKSMHYKLYSYIWHASTCSVSTCGGCFPRCQRHSIQQREIKLSQHENFMASVSDEIVSCFFFFCTHAYTYCLWIIQLTRYYFSFAHIFCHIDAKFALQRWHRNSLLAGTEQPLLSCVKMSRVDCGVIQRRDNSSDTGQRYLTSNSLRILQGG